MLIAGSLFILGIVLGLIAEFMMPESLMAGLIDEQLNTIEGWAGILKPFAPDELYQRVGSILERLGRQ